MINVKKVLVLSLVGSSFLFGATVPNVGNIVKEINPPKNIVKKKKDLIDISGVKQIVPAMIDDKSGKKVLVKEFEITGNTKLSTQELLNKISKYKNRELSFAEMKEVATEITKFYRLKGYFVARAYIPVQNMQDGSLKIAVIEGEVGVYNIKNGSKVDIDVIQGIFDESEDKIISTSTIERSLLIVNDLPGLVVSKANVKPGSSVGTSDFDVETTATSDYNGYIVVDNYGSRYTGKNRVMASFDINSPFKVGDKLSFVGLLSNGKGLKYLSASYDTLLNPNGLRGGFGYSYTGYELKEEYENLDAKGYSKDLNLFNLSYPIIRERNRNLYAKLSLNNKKIRDEIRSTDSISEKEITVATLSLDYENASLIDIYPTSTTLQLAFTRGTLSFENDADMSLDMAGANTNGTYNKIYLEAFKSISFTQRLSLEGTFKYQHSLGHKNLDGSEDLSIGGSQGVKVYPTSEASAENGYVATIEVKYILPTVADKPGYTHKVGIFYDRARAYAANNTNVIGDDISLQDMGLAYYASYKDFFLNSFVAWRLNSDVVTSEPDYNSKVMIQAGWVF